MLNMLLSQEVESIIDSVISASVLLGDHTTEANCIGCAFILGTISSRLKVVQDEIKLGEDNGRED